MSERNLVLQGWCVECLDVRNLVICKEMALFFQCIIFQTNKWDAIMNHSGLPDSIARPLCALILIIHSRVIMLDSVAN